MSFVGVTTLTLSNILGAIVSVEPPVEVSVAVEEPPPPSLLLLQEMIVRLKRGYENYVENIFHLNLLLVMKEKKFEKSHIHILESKTLSRES